MGRLNISRLIPAPIGEVYRHVTDFENLRFWLNGRFDVELAPIDGELKEQKEIELNLKRFGMRTRAVVRIESLLPGEKVSYRQVVGFFKEWVHTQVLVPHDEKTTLLTDLVEFKMPLGLLGSLADDLIVRKDIENVLTVRQIRIEEHFLHAGPHSASVGR